MSEPQTDSKLIYTGECRTCDRYLTLSLPANKGNVKANGPMRVRCSECEDISHLEQTDTES